MIITICDHCRKEITGDPDRKDTGKPASIPLPVLEYQKPYKDSVTRMLQFKVYDNTRNDAELCINCALEAIANHQKGN